MPKSRSERPDTQLTAEPALEKRTRRQLTPEYKLRIIADEEKVRQKTAKTYPGKPSGELILDEMYTLFGILGTEKLMSLSTSTNSRLR